MSCSPPPRTEQPDLIPPPATPLYDPVGVFWDYENCPPSTNASGYNIVDNIRTIANQFGAVNTFKAYLQLPDKSSPRQFSLRSELQSCGLSLTDCPHNGKNSVDLMMIVDIMAFIKDNPPPATVILISGDRDFAYLLSTVRWRKYNVVLISNSFMTHESLTVQASVVYDWKSDILKTRPPSKPPLLGSHTLSPVTSLTTPQESDNLPDSNFHAVGLPNERVAPTIKSSTLSPRPTDTATISTSRHRTPPPDAQPIEAGAEATLMTPRAGTPAGAESASNPVNATSDHRVVPDSRGGSTMGPASPKTTDLVDEDDFYSPAFSSPEMTPSTGEGDFPSSPGRLLLIDERTPVEPSTHDIRDTDLSGAIKPISRACEACECGTYVKSPVLLASTQEIVGGHQAESTPCKPLSPLPTAPPSVPPPESSPGHDISPSEAEVRRRFEDLIAVLSELSANGNRTPRFSTVFPLWKGRRPEAYETVGAAKFKAYIQLAESVGVVTVEQHQDGDGLVTLRRQWNTNSNNSPQHTLPQHAGLRFRDLIKILNDLWLTGDPEPRLSTVCQQLLRSNPTIYEDADMTRFEYIEAAVEVGVVTVRGVKNGDGSLKLCPAYRSPHVCSSTPVRAASTPPTLAPSTAPSFTPLVEFLKSKRSTSAQPISLSEVFAHLVSTLGYADLSSLCTSIPGVTTFGQYIDAAIASGVISLVEGTTASTNALVSLRDTGPARGVGLRPPDSLPPQTKPSISTTPLPSLPPRQEIKTSPPSVNVTPSSFRDLVMVLTGLQASTGESVFRFSRVAPFLLKRRPDAYASVGVARFVDYVTLAMDNGVVRAEGMDQGDGWVFLSDPRPGGPAVTSQLRKSPGGGVDPKFVDLVETLGEIWKNGEKKPLLSFVAAQLLEGGDKMARSLNACGVNKFKAYVELARDAGIVEIFYGRPWEERMSLNPAIRVRAGYT